MDQLTRRAFLRGTGIALSLPLLAACATAPAAAPTSAPAAAPPPTSAPRPTTAPVAAAQPTVAPAVVATTRPAVALGQLPTFVPFAGPKPDLAGSGDGMVSPGFINYPKDQLVQSVKNPPGRGGDVSVTLETSNPPVPSLGENPAWQAVNKAVNAKLNVTIIPFGDFNAKWATIQAGNELPDLMCTITRPDVPIIPAFLNAKCQDLTPYLAGDAVKDYPNLAALPSRSWKSTLINGKIFGTPIPLKPYFWWFWAHEESLEQAGLSYPTSAAEFKETALRVRNPQQNLWAIASNGGSQYAYDTVQGLWNAAFRAPNYWSVDKAGKFTYLFETDEYRQAMAYAADLVKNDLYHPSSLNYNVNSGRNDFRARKFVFREDGLQNQFGAFWGGVNAVQMEPPSRIRMVPPFSADGTTPPVYYFGRPNFGMALVKKADDARVREMLRILDYLAAPFGSVEGHLLRYGVEDIDFRYDERGNPQLTEQGKAEIQAWGSLTSSGGTGGGAEVWYSPQEPDFVPVLQGYERLLSSMGIEDASLGTFSPTFASKGTTLLDGVGGGAQDIIAGRRPQSDLDGLVREWRANGGTQIKEELAQSYAQLNGG
jgi:putative aldouronate transport system substrate-binding protein